MNKHLYFSILMIFLGGVSIQAQHKASTGPMVKNRKPWKHPKQPSLMVVKKHDHTPVTGPLAKNKRPFEDVCETVPVVFRKRRKLTGPLAKNARPERGNYWEPETEK